MKKIRAFTLIELLVVIVIIGVLATLAVVAISSARTRARDAKRVSDLKQISTALELYMADENSYPTYVTPGQPMVGLTSGKTYMSKVPNNPTPRVEGVCGNSDYQYSGNSDDYSLLGCVSKDTGGAAAGFINYGKSGVVRNNSLIGHWIAGGFNSATVATDLSGNGNNCTVNGDVTLVASRNGDSSGAYKFNASGAYLYCGDLNFNRFYGANGQASFVFGFKYDSNFHRNSVLFDKPFEVSVSLQGASPAGYIAIYLFPVNMNPWSAIASSIDLTNGWHHVAIVYDNTQTVLNNKIKIYLDGNKGSNVVWAYANAIPVFTGVSDTSNSGNISHSTSYFSESIDEIQIYDRVLTQLEITALYNTWLNQ